MLLNLIFALQIIHFNDTCIIMHIKSANFSLIEVNNLQVQQILFRNLQIYTNMYVYIDAKL